MSNFCKKCENGTLTEETDTSFYGVPLRFYVCSSCGGIEATREQMKANKQAMLEHRKAKKK